MELNYNIIKTFLGSLEYNFPDPLKSLFNPEDTKLKQDTTLDVKVWSANDSGCYVVDIHIEVTEGFKDNKDFQLKLVHSTLVEVEDTDMDETEIVKILGAKVPMQMFGVVQTLVQAFTFSTGFPPVILENYDFEEHQMLVKEDEDTEPALGYAWIIKDIRSTEEGAAFLETLRNAYKDQLLEYSELALYKYYYRFMQPIEYHHPDFDNCEANFWDIFFQLIFAEADEVKMVDGECGIPEIIFTFPGYEPMTVSQLTLEELKSITSEMAVQAFTSSFVGLYQLTINKDYAETLSDINPPLDEEIHSMLNNSSEMSEEATLFIEQVCSRIKRYDLLTFPYRLFRE